VCGVTVFCPTSPKALMQRRSRWAASERPALRVVPTLEASMAKTKDRKLKKVHVPAHTKVVKGKKVRVKEHYRSTPD